MRNSIRFKMTSILILIVGWVIVFTWFLNNTFSEKYYVSSEKASIVKTFDKVKNILKNEENQELEAFNKMLLESQEDTQTTYHKLFVNKDFIWDREQFAMDETIYKKSVNEIDTLIYFSEHKQECTNYHWNLPYQDLVKEYSGDKFISFEEYPLEYAYRFINLLKREKNIETKYQKEKTYRVIIDFIQKKQFIMVS